MVALMVCYNSIAPCASKDDISASAICHLRGSVIWCIGRPTQVSSYCFGGLSCNFSLYFAALWVQTPVNDSEVIDCTHELTLLSSCDLFSWRKKTLRGQSACKNKMYNLRYLQVQKWKIMLEPA